LRGLAGVAGAPIRSPSAAHFPVIWLGTRTDNRRLIGLAASALEPPRSIGAAGRPDYSSDDGPTHSASINLAAGGFARQTMPRPRAWARPTRTATASAARPWLRTNYRRIDGLPNPDDDDILLRPRIRRKLGVE